MPFRICFLFLTFCNLNLAAQDVITLGDSAAQGIRFKGANNSFEGHLYGFLHFHSKFTGNINQNLSSGNDFRFNMSRVRIGMEGFLLKKEFRYHLQFGLGGPEIYTVTTSPIRGYNGLLDAFIEYDVFKNFTVSLGQRFVPGHRESFIGMANIQFIDRSLLFNFSGHDRDAGVFIWYKFKVNDFIVKPSAAITGGQGRNTAYLGIGGLNYNFRTDIYFNGEPANFGEYILPDYVYENEPRLILGFGYNYNEATPRSLGFTGEFFNSTNDIEGIFGDLLFKFKGFSALAEVYRKNTIFSPSIFDPKTNKMSYFEYGTGYNLQTGYFLNKKNEVLARYTNLWISAASRQSINEYTIGWNRYLSGKNFKFQSLLSYYRENNPNKSNLIIWLNTVFGF